MYLGLIDNAFAHHKIGFSTEYSTPYKPLIWDRSCQPDIVVFNDLLLHKSKEEIYKNKKKIAWLIEPYRMMPGPYKYVLENRQHFIDVFTHEPDMFKTDPIILAGTWIYKK